MKTKLETIIKNYAHDYRGIAMDRDDLEKLLISFGNEYAGQAVKEVIEDLENLPNFWCELPGFIEYYSCVRDILNKLKAK